MQASGADLHALRVEHDGDVRVELTGRLADRLQVLAVFFVRAVREVQPRDVHAGANHGLDGFERITRRADGRDDFRLAQDTISSHE